MKIFTIYEMNKAIDRVEIAKQNHPVGWGCLGEFGLPDDLVAYAFVLSDTYLVRLSEENDPRIIYSTGWLQGTMIGVALGEAKHAS